MIEDILFALDSFPSSNLSIGSGGLTNPVALVGIVAVGWFIEPLWRAVILGALWMALVRIGMVILYELSEGNPG